MPSTISNSDLLRRQSTLSRLTSQEINKISTKLEKRRFMPGDNLTTQDTHSDLFFILLSGRVTLIAGNKSERKFYYSTLRAGDVYGEIYLIDGLPCPATAKAETQTDAFILRRIDFLEILNECDNFSYAILINLTQNLRRANKKIAALAFFNVHMRVCQALFDLGTRVNEDTLVINGKLSRQNIARMVGASREAVSRSISKLSRQGIIKRSQKNQFFVDFRRLPNTAISFHEDFC